MDKLNPPCGCRNALDPEWGVLKSISKCDKHRAKAGRGGLDYYRDMHALDSNGIPRHKFYVEELKEALGNGDLFKPHYAKGGGTLIQPKLLEIGAGLGMYCPMALKEMYAYWAVEPDTEAAAWIRGCFDVVVYSGTFEDYHRAYYSHSIGFEMIIAAHVLEHLKEGPAALRKMFDLLSPHSSRLVLIVPDDSDPINPDHLWLFTPENLKSSLERTGFIDIKIEVRRRVKHENFIYAIARKPS